MTSGSGGSNASGGNFVYECPVYKTQQRGPTYVFNMQLKTKHDPAKWILASCVAVMDPQG